MNRESPTSTIAAPSDPGAGLTALLRPRSVAVVGASPDTSKVSGKPLQNLKRHGFSGDLYAVNPKYTDLDGIPCVPAVGDLPRGIDCALVLLPADRTLSAVRDLAARGAKAAIVVSGGFAEGGEAGRALQAEMAAAARAGGMRLLGPNTLGAVNFHDRAVLSFSTSFESGGLEAGGVAFASQSGALTGALANRAADRRLGLAYAVATGNEADLDLSDFLAFFAGDDRTRVVMGLVEGVREGRKFLRAGKPAVLLKAGSSEAGERCALAHTGALAGSARVFEAACRKAGALLVRDLEELLDAAEVLAKGRLPRKRTLGVVTTSGGAAALLADAAGPHGFALPAPAPATAAALTPLLPGFARQSLNPVDLTGQHLTQPEVYREAVRAFLADEAFGAVVVVMAPGTGEVGRERAEILAELDRATDKPLLACWIGGTQSAPGREACRAGGVPMMTSPRSVADALAHLAAYAERPARPSGSPETPPPGFPEAVASLGGGPPLLSEHGSERWLAACGLPAGDGLLARTEEEALAGAGRLGYPVVMKGIVRDVLHKQRLGLVRLGVAGPGDAARAFAELRQAVERAAPGEHVEVLIEPMAPPGADLIIGSHNDPTFGPVVAFGWGGIHAEIFDRVALRPAPVSRGEAEGMIAEVKGLRAVAESEFGGPVDWSPLTDALVRVSHLAALGEETIESIDVNPIRLLSRSGACRVLDASVVLRNPGREEQSTR